MSKKRDNKILSEPFLDLFDDNTLRIRRNLLLLCGFTLFYIHNSLSLSKDSSFLGLRFSNLSIESVNWGVFFVVLYHVIHFIWNAFDFTLQSRLRITGNKVTHVTVGKLAGSDGDYPDDPKQSTLYNWWNDSLKEIGNIKIQDELDEIKKNQKELIRLIKEKIDSPQKDNIINNLSVKVSEIDRKLNSLSFAKQIDKILSILKRKRIIESLRRFEGWFCFYQWQQVFRIFVIEIGMPIILGIYTLTQVIKIL